MARSKQKPSPLYEQVADRIESLIRKGAMKPGERIPSIRGMSNQMSVAISTVIHAYQLLESQGLIEARPQSGYFVRPKYSQKVAQTVAPVEPEMLRVPLKAGKARIEDANLLRSQSVADTSTLPVGMSLPSPEFLPIDTLSRHLARAVRCSPEAASRYEFAPGLLELRQRVARRAMDSGCSLGPDEVVITNGTTEALEVALRAITKPGDAIAVESPCYFGFLTLANLLQLRVVELSTDPRDGVSTVHLEKLLRHEKLNVKALVVNPTVHNPLGGIMSDEKKRCIATLMDDARVAIIEDDTYGDLAFGPSRPKCIKSFDTSGNVILCSSFSKTLAPGYRIGWVSGGRWHDRINNLKCTMNIGTSTPPQMAIASYLGDGGFDANLRRLRKTYRDQLKLLSDSVRRHFPVGTRATNPQGGHLLWVEFPARVDTNDLAKELTSRGISLLPGSMFSAGRHYKNCLRLNAAIPWSPRVEETMTLIGRLA